MQFSVANVGLTIDESRRAEKRERRVLTALNTGSAGKLVESKRICRNI